MTRKNLDKIKSILILMLIVILSVSLLLVSACAKPKEEKDDEKTYTKIEKDEQELTNGNFEFGSADVELKDFPYTTISGWRRETDDSSLSSKVNSGILDTKTENFEAAIKNLASNSTFKDWAKKKFNIVDETVKADVIAKNPSADAEKIKELVDAEIIKLITAGFTNPAVPTGVTSSKVLMLNNYTDDYGIGSAQKVMSSKSFTLKPDSYGKFTVWVKTAFLTPSVNTAEFGANIRLTNTVSSVTQSDYRISNIQAGEWTKYNLFVKANDFSDATVKLVLGLGYGSGNSTFTNNYVEGTAYFDECAYEEIEKADYTAAIASHTADKLNFVAASDTEKTEATVVTANSVKSAFLDLTSVNYFNGYTLPSNLDGKITESNKGASGMPAGGNASLTHTTNSFTINATNASYTVDVKDTKFSVEPNSYMLINFKLSMNLSKLQRSGLSLYIVDEYTDTVTGKVSTNTKLTLDNVIIEEDASYTLIIKNNFDKKLYPSPRTFYLSFILGPVDVATQTDATYYTTGSATVKDITTNSGSLDEKAYNEDNNTPTDKDSIYFYNVYSLLSKSTDTAKVYTNALFAGFTADYVEEDEKDTYSFKVAYSDEGTINSKPANVADYLGFFDYKKTYTELHNNENAGLINTKYLSNYSAGVQAALKGAFEADKNIQPIMIYNDEVQSYGFASETKTLAAESFASVSVKVRVTGNANAYIYLVNTGKGENLLETVTHSFTADDGKKYDNKLALRVTANDMGSDGWVTVKFYVASGKTANPYRLEMWNGERMTGEQKVTGSEGFVFFNDATFESSFDEKTVIADAEKNLIDKSNEVFYTRKLDEAEIKFNKDKANKDKQIKYTQKIVWASNMKENNNGTFVFAIYNTINPTAVNPNPPVEEKPDTDKKGCAKVDTSTLWLSLSSILLAVVLVGAMIALVVKKIKLRHQKNKNDGKAHYKVTSRNKTNASIKAKPAKVVSDFEDEDDGLADETSTVEKKEEVKSEEISVETDEYQYGEVLEDFGEKDKDEDNEDKKD